MDYVQRAVYGPNHHLSHLMHNRVHLSDGHKTLCGKILNEMWFVTGNTANQQKVVTCPKCKRLSSS